MQAGPHISEAASLRKMVPASSVHARREDGPKTPRGTRWRGAGCTPGAGRRQPGPAGLERGAQGAGRGAWARLRQDASQGALEFLKAGAPAGVFLQSPAQQCCFLDHAHPAQTPCGATLIPDCHGAAHAAEPQTASAADTWLVASRAQADARYGLKALHFPLTSTRVPLHLQAFDSMCKQASKHSSVTLHLQTGNGQIVRATVHIAYCYLRDIFKLQAGSGLGNL